MAQDPTQPARDFVKKGLSYLIPENSPLAQSGDDVLTPEARAKVEADAAATRAPADLSQAPVDQVPTDFVTPGQAQAPVAQPVNPLMSMPQGTDALATYKKGANLEANAIAKQGQQEAAAYGDVQNQLDSINQDIQSVQSKEEQAFQEFQKEDDDVKKKIQNFELKPKNFFAGKNTWQKVLGGLGMFLGSITPEGAKNVANIIDKEIERDLDVQRNQLALLKDTRSEAANRYKMKLDRFGSDKLAKMSMKKDALEMVKLQLGQIAASAKGDLARGASLKGIATIEQHQQDLQANFMKEYLKANKDSQKGMIPGYQGSNQNPTIVKDLTDRVSARNSAFASIDKLEKLLQQGALYGKNSEIATQTRKDLASAIAKAKFGKSSDTELAFASDLIPDVTSMFQRGSVDKALFKNLKDQINTDVEAAANAAGFTKALPLGARKM